MNEQGHRTIHSLVPVYTALHRINKKAIEGIESHNHDAFLEIRDVARDGMIHLMDLEKQIASDNGHRRRKYEQTSQRQMAIDRNVRGNIPLGID
jgi:bisphosphoglycerate-independent phosphoglycerate mutase (AlkP superfamily)